MIEIEHILSLLRENDLYTEDVCDCETFYCSCEHQGFMAAYDLIKNVSEL